MCMAVCREVVQELTDEYIASTRPDYISRGSAKVSLDFSAHNLLHVHLYTFVQFFSIIYT